MAHQFLHIENHEKLDLVVLALFKQPRAVCVPVFKVARSQQPLVLGPDPENLALARVEQVELRLNDFGESNLTGARLATRLLHVSVSASILAGSLPRCCLLLFGLRKELHQDAGVVDSLEQSLGKNLERLVKLLHDVVPDSLGVLFDDTVAHDAAYISLLVVQPFATIPASFSSNFLQ